MNGQNGQIAKTALVVDESHACKYRVTHDFIRWRTCPSGEHPMSTYSSVDGLPEEWDIATSPIEEPLRLSYERRHHDGESHFEVWDTIYIDAETAGRICRALAYALGWKVSGETR